MALNFEGAGAMQRRQGSRNPLGLAKLAARSRSSPMLNKKPGAVSRPGAVLEFQFPEYTDLPKRVNNTEASLSRRMLMGGIPG
jgi:hypothetical protein